MNPPPDPSLARTKAANLSKLLTDEPPGATWHPAELAAILKHQFSSPLEGVGVSFEQLMNETAPSIESLQRFQTFAKASMSSADAPLPREVAAVFYYGCILLARLRLEAHISQLDDSSLLTGTKWVLRQDWIDSRLTELFQEGNLFLNDSP